MSGKFVTFEGPDGAGKTTVLNKLLDNLHHKLGAKLVTSREPGGNPIAESIRNVILDRENTKMDARTEALLYAASRRQNIIQTIKPALKENKLVICDRFLDSSIAYQGGGRKIGEELVYNMNQFATEGFLPDLTIYFDIPVEVGLQRIAKNRDANDIDRLDVETIDFHKRVHKAYQDIVHNDSNRVKIVNATRSVEDVYNDVLSLMKSYVNEFM